MTNYRMVRAQDNSFIHLGGAIESHSYSQTPWGATIREGLVSVSVIGSDGVIDGVVANGMTMSGSQVDLRNVNPEIEKGSARGRTASGRSN
ncbi:MAG: hypothetical protein H0T52_12905 [Lautropia sp.]|nr:hypothetical protein [Lautropia sp.]